MADVQPGDTWTSVPISVWLTSGGSLLPRQTGEVDIVIPHELPVTPGLPRMPNE